MKMILPKELPHATELLFVYGTLLSGLSNHHHMVGAACLGPAIVQGALFDMGDYPAMLVSGELSAPLGPVLGELYKIEAPHWPRLDALEAVDPDSIENSMYLRRTAEVTWLAGEAQATVRAQVYIYNWSLVGRPRIEQGDFRRHVSKDR
jgi:gamma-glutamylcyclotransferase (GGCT)/AIG2-like uncharacterized protein YtfP